MAQTIQKQRVVGNPAGKKKKYRQNVGDILGFTLAAGNPGGKGKKHMAKTTAKKTASGRSGKKQYKKNTGGSGGHHKSGKSHKKSYKRNTGGAGVGPILTNATFVIVGALGSKLGAQVILGTKNNGLMGYAGNAAVGGALWFITEKWMRSRAASSGILAGTVVQILLRAINDYTPFGSYISQLGMGDYQMQSFVTPQVLVDPMNSAEVAVPNGWGGPQMALAAPASSPAAAMVATSGAPAGGGGSGAGMSGLYGGGWGGGLYG